MTQATAKTNSTEIAKWAGRKNITRINPTDKNSAYMAISLLLDAEKRIGYLDLSSEHEGEIRFGFAPLPMTAAPMFTVTKLDYLVESLGSRALHGARHMSEVKETLYVAIDAADSDVLPAELGIKVMGKWRTERKDGETVYFDTTVSLAGVSDADIEKALNKEAKRIVKNEPPVDTRVKIWNKNENDVTNFGKFKAQQSSDRSARKAAK